MKTDKFVALCIPLLFANAGCAGNPHEAMKRFADQKDRNVAERENISVFLRPNLLFVVRGVQEIRPGVMEYFFEPKYSWSEAVKCKYIYTVAKDTGTIIGWRYNGKPENCQQNR